MRNTSGKMVPLPFYHRVFGLPYNLCQTFRAKKSIDTKAQKLLRPVLESAAQGLSSTISTVMIQVHSTIPIYYNSASPSSSRSRCLVLNIRVRFQFLCNFQKFSRFSRGHKNLVRKFQKLLPPVLESLASQLSKTGRKSFGKFRTRFLWPLENRLKF